MSLNYEPTSEPLHIYVKLLRLIALTARGAQLGAGLGHLSVALARMGAHVTTTESACEKGGGGTCACWGCLEQLRRSLVSQLGESHGCDPSVDLVLDRVPPSEIFETRST